MNRRLAALSLLATAAGFASAQANFVYGLSQNASSKVEIVHVNTATGAQTNFADLGNIAGNINGLASVLGTATFYFASDNRLYKYDHAAAPASRLTQFGGTLAGAAPGNAAWYNGSYYYVNNNTRELRKATPTGASTFADTLVKQFSSALSGFGDITFNTTSTNAGDGTLYLSSGQGLLRYKLGDANYSTISAGTPAMQLGFAQDNNLYGIESSTSTAFIEKVYRINLSTGARTEVSTFSNGASVYIRDAATAPTPPVPEPASMAVLGIGLAALRRRRAAKK